MTQPQFDDDFVKGVFPVEAIQPKYVESPFSNESVSVVRVTAPFVLPGVVGGFVLVPLDYSGFSIVRAVLIRDIVPSIHTQFTWYPRTNNQDVVVTNLTASAQNITIAYILLGILS